MSGLNFRNYPDMLSAPNIDLSNRVRVHNPQTGKSSSVWSMSIGVEEGGEEITVLIPRLKPDGTIMSEQEAIEWFRKTGQHMGKFKTRKEADRFSREYSKSVGEVK
jgi:hypothetical protein